MLPANFFKIERDPWYISGKADGEAKGVTKGIAKGIAKGEKKNKKETALEMKKRGFELSLISDITKLPVKQIEKL
jgi:predicted transposase/invertase (TIGR01784 family)